VGAYAVVAAAVAGRAAVAPLVGRRAWCRRARAGGAPGHVLGGDGEPVGTSAAASAAAPRRATDAQLMRRRARRRRARDGGGDVCLRHLSTRRLSVRRGGRSTSSRPPRTSQLVLDSGGSTINAAGAPSTRPPHVPGVVVLAAAIAVADAGERATVAAVADALFVDRGGVFAGRAVVAAPVPPLARRAEEWRSIKGVSRPRACTWSSTGRCRHRRRRRRRRRLCRRCSRHRCRHCRHRR